MSIIVCSSDDPRFFLTYFTAFVTKALMKDKVKKWIFKLLQPNYLKNGRCRQLIDFM